jgi:hypothetical protein
MPHVAFESLPPKARAWVFGASAPLDDAGRTRLLAAVDEYLSQWRAHGEPLNCSRDFRDDRFLVIAVDEAATGASGCSIDGLFRTLQSLQITLGTTLVGGGPLFYRDREGQIVCVDRSGFLEKVREGAITADTTVFDLTVATVADWLRSFEKPAIESWHARLLTLRT